MTNTLDIVGLCGSLREGSFNAKALRTAGEYLNGSATFEVLDWHLVPPFNSDVLERQVPESVVQIRDRIACADGVVIATPEYNFSVPGMLKNLLDWLSRGEDQPLAGKPVALLSAATGPLGGARVQYELRRVLLFFDAMVLVKPEVFIGQAHTKFGSDGCCIDLPTKGYLSAQMTEFLGWIAKVQAMRS